MRFKKRSLFGRIASCREMQITRQYIYLADQPIAVIDTPQGKSLQKEKLLAPVLLGLDAQNILKHL